jgi:hypothetical protein
MSKLKIYTFSDIVFKPHTVIPGAVCAKIEFPNETHASIVGGGMGLYGDGDTTFEVWYSDEEDPRGWQSISDINEEFAQRSIRQLGLI